MNMNRIAAVALAVLALAVPASAHAGERLSLHAFADVESAYICRGYVWSTRPYSAQFADAELSLGDFGSVDAFVGQFGVVSDDARAALKERKVPEARRDLTFGGVGISLDF